ncbi:hypothetical protein ID866_7943 [Astraeus odoratus]|nr:hypothetical protein ID866_7943 [Astraeus odoratus]
MLQTIPQVKLAASHFKDTENRNEDAGFFVFPDLSVWAEGNYRLKLSLFEVVGYVPSLFTAPDWLASPSPETPSAIANPSTLPPSMYRVGRSTEDLCLVCPRIAISCEPSSSEPLHLHRVVKSDHAGIQRA